MQKISLFSNTCSSYIAHLTALLGKGPQHAGIVYESFFRTGVPPQDHPAFKNASVLLQAILENTEFSLPTWRLVPCDEKTRKLIVRFHDSLEVESVLIPMQRGGTLCISSQIGCRMGCTFCETGRMGLLRNLTVEEIVAQVFIARHMVGFDFRNVVFMGMGEPFDNYVAVLQAARVLMDARGFGFGRRKVTISTSGSVEGIRQYTQEPDAPNLAVSINASMDSQRNRLMPVNRKHDMAELYGAMKDYCTKTGRQILAAYVLLKGVNDTLEDADRLADYLRGLDVKINLIPYNPQSRDRFAPPETEVVEAFGERLRAHGHETLFRRTKGRPIMAGCGQLGNITLRKKLLAERTI
ncbi:MAG: 23S rRNA (adenine(2503)-C(2))-methyltransferase RlmN [Parachlamydia sp.]|nr:23S rRNA (adenine(2503)-C(2))-methyltransferase RlmN [Parachlamydia sp.]